MSWGGNDQPAGALDASAQDQDERTVFVGNLSYKSTEGSLIAVFSSYGQLRGARVVRQADGQSKGVAFVEFETKEDAKKAVAELNRKQVDGREVFLKLAGDPRTPEDEIMKIREQKGLPKRSKNEYRNARGERNFRLTRRDSRDDYRDDYRANYDRDRRPRRYDDRDYDDRRRYDDNRMYDDRDYDDRRYGPSRRYSDRRSPSDLELDYYEQRRYLEQRLADRYFYDQQRYAMEVYARSYYDQQQQLQQYYSAFQPEAYPNPPAQDQDKNQYQDDQSKDNYDSKAESYA
ncbi:hypothetical protein TVAG_475440 [Trichomonas vaginalis G3]|uniref:RRM domain-containing protein n=1 Tax=Trichomonas vaginalis (strain ATCC PRA-98 / G3) TaxID=412133 RepID=A2GKC7_TRIV3|nr:RNA binding [Trichomonas vaginalis G3]EAX82389.1 hypothetical protein TVAG_475440 [Trichomonas vaginalis G3]KAI5550693.1 RNA binding [Trichomonas vaginalis G3]|eukprot:XP_001295319.1 hypothetical protein [Trichomonas vaginalis G3]